MGQAVRKFEVVEGGSAMQAGNGIAEPIAEPLRNLEMWLSAEALAELASISERMGRKALNSRRWRGADLNVREIEIGRGGDGGKALQVHVDSLPADLREDWYLAGTVKQRYRQCRICGHRFSTWEEIENRDLREYKSGKSSAKTGKVIDLFDLSIEKKAG